MLARQIEIEGRVIGENCAPYVIAEAGSNFNQNFDTARRLIDVASDSGAQAVKFQLFRADRLYPGGGEMFDIFKSVELNSDWVPRLSLHAKDRGISFISSAFDPDSVDCLEAAGVPAHKIASSETTNLRLLLKIARTRKPLIVSTGMCDMVDVEEAVNVCLGVGANQLTLLQCGAMYPLPVEHANLRVIGKLSDRFGCPVGFSDHTLGQTAAIAALGLGGRVFEKHFTLDRSAQGPDHFYALEPGELKTYVSVIQEAYSALGSDQKEMLPDERKQGRREGLYAARAMSVGDVIRREDLVMRRPALGLRARYAGMVEGSKVLRSLERDEPITWDSFGW